MARTKKLTLVVKDAKFESGSEQADVRVKYPAGLTVEQALQAGIMLGSDFTIHADIGGLYDHELRALGVSWKCVKASAPLTA
jgi:hypothetical protein